MNRYLVCILLFALLFSLCSCGKKNNAGNEDKSAETDNSQSSVSSYIDEDTIDGSIDPDVEDVPELDLGLSDSDNSDADKSDNANSKGASVSSDNTGGSGNNSDSGSGSGAVGNTAESNGENDQTNDGWEPLT